MDSKEWKYNGSTAIAAKMPRPARKESAAAAGELLIKSESGEYFWLWRLSIGEICVTIIQ